MKKAILIVLGIYVVIGAFVANSVLNKKPSNSQSTEEIISQAHKMLNDTNKLIEESNLLLGDNKS